MKKFEERFLREVLSFNEEEIKLIMEAQKKFPSILVNDGKGFCVNARTIYRELEVSKDFSNWIKKNLEDLDANEKIDYTCDWMTDKGVAFKGDADMTSFTELIGLGYKKEYFITIDIAKEIAMIAGTKGGKTKDKLKENSRIARKYFIYLEKAVKRLANHEEVREPERKNYNIMIDELINSFVKNHPTIKVTDFDKKYLRVRESNMLNKSLMGLTASEVKAKLGYLDAQTREHLTIENNKVLNDLEFTDSQLIIGNVGFDERTRIIESICKSKYSNLRMDK